MMCRRTFEIVFNIIGYLMTRSKKLPVGNPNKKMYIVDHGGRAIFLIATRKHRFSTLG